MRGRCRGPLTVKPNQTCEWGMHTYGGQSPFSFAWYVWTGAKWLLLRSSDLLDMAVGTSGFTLKGQATDATNTTKSETVTITVSSSGSTCYLGPIRKGP